MDSAPDSIKIHFPLTMSALDEKPAPLSGGPPSVPLTLAALFRYLEPVSSSGGSTTSGTSSTAAFAPPRFRFARQDEPKPTAVASSSLADGTDAGAEALAAAAAAATRLAVKVPLLVSFTHFI